MPKRIERVQILTLQKANDYITKSHLKKSINKKITLEDAILLLLSSISYNKKIISRTLLMKEVFLMYEEILKEVQIGFGAREADYVAYKYGPYSYKVNTAVISLILNGKVQIRNYYVANKAQENDSEKKLKNKFLATYETKLDFEKIVMKYRKLLSSRGITLREFQKLIADKKRGWDQSGSQGIIRYVYAKYKSFIVKSELREVYPELFFGLVEEDKVPRVYGGSKRSISG